MLRFAALLAAAMAASDPSDIMPSCAVMGTGYVAWTRWDILD